MSGTFDSLILGGQGPIVVEFMSYACGHCGGMELILQRAAEAVEAREQVFRVNTGKEPELAQEYGIEATPTLEMFLNGDERGREEGPSPVLSTVLAEMTRPFEH